MEVTYDGHCFGCGVENRDGLGMRFVAADGVSRCELAVPARFQSWRGVVHGGMLSLMLDEALGWAAVHSGHPAVTGRLEVRFRRPLHVEELIRVESRVDRIRRTLVYASATITRLADGARIADADATLAETAMHEAAPRP